jgi:hypothetical protein
MRACSVRWAERSTNAIHTGSAQVSAAVQHDAAARTGGIETGERGPHSGNHVPYQAIVNRQAEDRVTRSDARLAVVVPAGER